MRLRGGPRRAAEVGEVGDLVVEELGCAGGGEDGGAGVGGFAGV